MNELIVVKQLPEIEEHLKIFKAEVDRKVEEALALVCTEETLQTVKKSRAELNSLYKALEVKRIAVKKQILTPYDEFEAVYKECVSDAFRNADIQLKISIDRVENGIKEEKLAKIKDYFAELCEAEGVTDLSFEELGIQITLSASEKKLKETVKEKVLRFKQDIEMIRTQNHAEEITVEYRKNGYDVSQAILKVTERHRLMEEEKKRAEEDANRKELEKAVEQKVEEAAGIALSAAEAIDTDNVHPVEEEETKIYNIRFTINATKKQVKELVDFMNERGIKYER